LKEYLIQYKPFLLFLAKFAASYLVLTFIYQSYLNQFDVTKMEVDDFTKVVAHQSQKVLSIFDTNSYTESNFKEASVKLFYKGKWAARIIEGCNALSIIILFVSFIIAFTGKLKPTLVFIICGSLLIHIMNIIRIALLCVALHNFPNNESLFHDIIFPLVIYGVVFMLWILWVNKYSYYAEKPATK
jgi:exosortase family protein XrtF